MTTEFKISSIATLKAPYGSKFGVPRQSGMIKSEPSQIIMNKSIPRSSLEPLKIGNFIWVLFIFDQCTGNEKLHVRPPRLGGNDKIGVFSTRSPFRPNNIGMSLGRIEDFDESDGEVIINISGLDLADKTPIIDIKPYHPNADLAWSESEYWFGDGLVEDLEVVFEPSINIENDLKEFIRDVLAKDPRPAYHSDEHRVYNIVLKEREVEFKIDDNKVIVIGVSQ